jgi:hypothetical protein
MERLTVSGTSDSKEMRSGMKITDYLSEEMTGDKVLVQGYVDKDLRKRVKDLLPPNIGWNEFLTAALKMFLDEKFKKTTR